MERLKKSGNEYLDKSMYLCDYLKEIKVNIINTKNDLKRFLEQDKLALGIRKRNPSILGDEIWKFQIVLRKHEYYLNTNSSKFLLYFYHYLHHRIGIKLGYTIPCNVFGAGLCIHHLGGGIVINENAKVGEWCEIFQFVNIGENNGEAPVIGSNSYIGPGAKIFGCVQLENNIMIGANCVVNKSFSGDNLTIAGVPAKVVNENNGRNVRLEMLNVLKLETGDS